MRGTFQFIRPKVIHNGISVVARTRLFWAPPFRRPERRVTLIYATPRMPPDAAMLYTRSLNFLLSAVQAGSRSHFVENDCQLEVNEFDWKRDNTLACKVLIRINETCG
jgi:hypothetical protein